MRWARQWRLDWTLCAPPDAAFSTAGTLVRGLTLPGSRQLVTPAERGTRQSGRGSTRNPVSMSPQRARLGPESGVSGHY